MEYILHIFIFILLYSMVALSLNVTSGFTQLISLAQAGFFGMGAYAAAILSSVLGWSPWLNIPIGMLVAGLVALPIAIVALRTTEDYFIICTMGLGVILFSLMHNWMELTNGPLGIGNISQMSVFGHPIATKSEWLILAVVIFVVILWLSHNIKQSALGRVLVAISDDEIFCRSLGKNVGLAKLQSFVVGAMLAAVPGVLYAHYVSFIDPASFSVNESIFILSIIIIGGMGNLWGCLIATALLIALPEALRFVGLPVALASNIRQMMFGVALIFVIVLQALRLKNTRRESVIE